MSDLRALLHAVADHAADWLESVDERPIPPRAGAPELRERLRLDGGPADARAVVDRLAAEAEPGLMAMGSPRFFGWVIGGALPGALAADWLAAAWDQNATLGSPTPAVAVVEEVAGRRAAELLGLPDGVSFAVVTGCQMAHVTALAAARHRVLAQAGWDVEREGLVGAPPIRVLAGEERHVTLDRALRLLGIGAGRVESVAVDERGAMRADALAATLGAGGGPAIVCAQVGNVNTGAIDPMEAVCDAARAHGAWVHVDGAFGLWAAASPARRHEVAGVERAESWATDGHKWLNVPYDCGLAFVADTAAHRAAMSSVAGYIPAQDADAPRSPMDWTPEFSRRARGVALYAALAELGRDGVAELVDRLCACAERFAEALRAEPGVEVLASGLNQVLVAFGDDDATDRAAAAIHADGTCYPSATVWRGRHALRISVSNFKTTFDEVDRSLAAMRSATGVTSPFAG